MTALLGVSTDSELVELAKTGDSDAFHQLFERHAGSVAAACRRKTRSACDVDDAVQEAFARALTNLHQLRNPEQFGGWVRSIAVRACMDQHRSARRVLLSDDDWEIDLADPSPQPDEVAEGRERDAAVWDSMKRLGERDRTALYLRHIVEAPVAAVADELGLTEGSTRVMLVRARERLRLAATGLAALVPMPWRRWLRHYLHTAGPTIEAIAVVFVVGITAGAIATPERPEPPKQAKVQSIERDRRADDRPRRREAPRKAERNVKPAVRAAAPAPLPAAAPPAPKAPKPAPAQRNDGVDAPLSVTKVKDSVQVRREYPKEEETQELVDVTVFSGEKENNVRLYGNNITKTTRPAAEPVKDAIGLGEE